MPVVSEGERKAGKRGGRWLLVGLGVLLLIPLVQFGKGMYLSLGQYALGTGWMKLPADSSIPQGLTGDAFPTWSLGGKPTLTRYVYARIGDWLFRVDWNTPRQDRNLTPAELADLARPKNRSE